MTIERKVITAGLVILGLLLALFAKNFVFSPIRSQRNAVAEQLESLEAGIDVDINTRPPQDFDALNSIIISKPSLWKPLMAAPVAQAQAPDLAALLKDVQVTGNKVVTPQGETKVRIKLNAGDPGKYMGVGETIAGCTIKEISNTHVVFALTQNGTEYTLAKPRGG